jgi:hypothetical protein
VTHFDVYAERPADSTLLLSVDPDAQQRLERIPRMVAADARFYSRENEKAGQALSVRWMSVPNKKTTSGERELLQHQRWFRRGQKGEPARRGGSACSNEDTDCVVAYPGLEGMRRWVGLGVIADNVIQMGCYLARPSYLSKSPQPTPLRGEREQTHHGKPISVVCNVTGYLSENAFWRRKVALCARYDCQNLAMFTHYGSGQKSECPRWT